jgi:hypothetical protein
MYAKLCTTRRPSFYTTYMQSVRMVHKRIQLVLFHNSLFDQIDTLVAHCHPAKATWIGIGLQFWSRVLSCFEDFERSSSLSSNSSSNDLHIAILRRQLVLSVLRVTTIPRPIVPVARCHPAKAPWIGIGLKCRSRVLSCC